MKKLAISQVSTGFGSGALLICGTPLAYPGELGGYPPWKVFGAALSLSQQYFPSFCDLEHLWQLRVALAHVWPAVCHFLFARGRFGDFDD